jgi:microsomal prostaglandin-E synthase 2
MPKEVTVYQYKICPFCNRVKAYLDYLRIPYKAVEVNPLTKGEVSFSKGYKKVPILLVDGLQVNDSGPIIEHISNDVVKANPELLKKHSALFAGDTDKWGEWSEKRLAVMLYPNITRNMDESWECFEYTNHVQEWNVLNRMGTRAIGAFFMSLANGKIKKKYNIVDERKELQQCLLEWTDAVGSNDFLHGDAITLPDLHVFGVLRAIEGLKTHDEIMSQNAPLKAWYGRMKEQVSSCEMGA